MTSGIYKITNLVNNKMYVGSAVNLVNREKQHFQRLSKNIHSNIHLQRAFNKHGIDNFLFELLEACPKELLIEREQYWIDKLCTVKNGYNIRMKADSNLGIKFSQQSIKRMSLSHKGQSRKHSEETKKKLSNLKKGMVFTKEHKEKISQRLIGNNYHIKQLPWKKKRVFTEEHRRKLSESHKGQQSPMKGKQFSEEHRKKLSISKQGNKNGIGYHHSKNFC